ncbi:MAG: sulfotransferase [Acidimicrobiales bacterium]|nr:sulfotransferase [Acidimicrobiales bacterium]
MGATLRVDDIVARAVAVDGLQPADGAPWLGALELLVESASSEAGLHSGGAEAMRAKLVTLVAERLRAEVLLGANAEIRERPLPVRFVVAGLARSGTTLLHRLLSCDPDVEFLPTWQAFHPVPPLTGPDERRQDTVDAIEAMRRADPDAFAVHPLDADAPEEEVFLLQHSFASMLFALTCPLPSYNAWLSTTRHEAAYRFACDLLRLNEWRVGRRAVPGMLRYALRWVAAWAGEGGKSVE